MAVKILHAADFHLDSPFESLPEEKARRRRAEQRELLERIAELVRDERIELVLLSGDLLDSATSYYETQEVLYRAFKDMDAEILYRPAITITTVPNHRTLTFPFPRTCICSNRRRLPV